MPLDFDFHTHRLDAPAGRAIINIPREWMDTPETAPLRRDAYYSVGIHPWWTDDETAVGRWLTLLPQWISRPEVIAIGECGLDKLHGADLSLQEDIFSAQLHLALRANMPVIVHCVRAFDRLLYLKKVYGESLHLTVHGFRGGPALASQLLAANINISFGKLRNEAAFLIVPPERRRVETDEE